MSHWNRTRLSAKGLVSFLQWVEEQYGPQEILELPKKSSGEMVEMILLYTEEAEEKRLKSIEDQIGKLERKKSATLERLEGMKPKY